MQQLPSQAACGCDLAAASLLERSAAWLAHHHAAPQQQHHEAQQRARIKPTPAGCWASLQLQSGSTLAGRCAALLTLFHC
jgi:hypothetical protein